VVQGEGPAFKPQYCKKKREREKEGLDFKRFLKQRKSEFSESSHLTPDRLLFFKIIQL
jgi:hypothetical protein